MSNFAKEDRWRNQSCNSIETWKPNSTRLRIFKRWRTAWSGRWTASVETIMTFASATTISSASFTREEDTNNQLTMNQSLMPMILKTFNTRKCLNYSKELAQLRSDTPCLWLKGCLFTITMTTKRMRRSAAFAAWNSTTEIRFSEQSASTSTITSACNAGFKSSEFVHSAAKK